MTEEPHRNEDLDCVANDARALAALAFRLSEKLNRLAETMRLTKLVDTPPADDLSDLQLREAKNSTSRSCDASTGWLQAGD